MSFRFCRNHRDTHAEELSQPPWQTSSPVPAFADKDEMRKWENSETTNHVFFTLVEGVNPHLRVSAENPALRLHGWVVDFDGPIPAGQLAENCVKMLPVELRPAWVCNTFSGNARAVWLFEEPQWVDQPQVYESFAKRLNKLLQVVKVGPGYDAASTKLAQTWELGTNWVVVPHATALPERTLASLWYESVLATRKVKETYIKIPWEDLQAGVEEKFPGQLDGITLGDGVRVPLFWLGDGRPERSAIVAEWGVWSHSTRSEKGATLWSEILGEDFVRQYKERRIHAGGEGIYYDGSRYWFRDMKSLWIWSTKEDLVSDMKVRGYSAKVREEKTASEAEEILYYVRHHNRVDFAAPLCHTRQELVRFNGDVYLNTRRREPLAPAVVGHSDNWPWLRTYFENFLQPAETDTIHPAQFFMAELQRSYRSVIEADPRSGHMMIFAGKTGRGKSFLTTKVMRHIFGSAADAAAFLLSGGASFNRAQAESYIWYVDDEEASASFRDHAKFTSALKKYTATPEVMYKAKYRDEFAVPWYGRIVIACNDDPASLAIIPSLDRNNLDKISLFRYADWQAEFLPNAEMESLVLRELPFFLRWLLDDFVPPEGVLDDNPRYGIKPYHSPELVEFSRQSDPKNALVDVLDMWLPIARSPNCHPQFWEGTATELLKELLGFDDFRALLTRESPTSFGMFLRALEKDDSYKPLKKVLSKRGRRHYVFQLPTKKEVDSKSFLS